MEIKQIAAAALAFALSCASISSHSITVTNFEKIEDETVRRIYLQGLYDGMSLISGMIGEFKNSGDPVEETYCVPEALSLNSENLIGIVEKFGDSADEKTKQNTHVSVMLMAYLTSMFPCKDQ